MDCFLYSGPQEVYFPSRSPIPTTFSFWKYYDNKEVYVKLLFPMFGMQCELIVREA